MVRSDRESRTRPIKVLSVITTGLAVAGLYIVTASSDAWAFRPRAAAVTSEKTRQPQYNDFLRLIYANLPSPPTTLGGPSAYRVFFGATSFYDPPIRIAQIANFSGIPVRSDRDLYVLRCLPPSDSEADPTLALWPNLISRILADYQTNPPAPDTADEAVEEIAQSFTDTSSQVLTETLENALNLGKQFFEDFPQTGPLRFTATQMQAQMSMRFGTFPAFTGLGYAAEGTGNSPSFDSEQAMRSMVIPDFVLKNVTLAEAGCHCIQVPSTVPNRDQRKLDPDFVLRRGGDGSCVKVNRTTDLDP
jgi:hypothetical protein